MSEQNEDEKVDSTYKNTKSEGLSILSLLFLICLNTFVNNILRKVRDKWPQFGRYIQPSAVSVLFGFVFGYCIQHYKGADVSLKLRTSFEPLFMNFFLPFIINDGAVNAFPKNSFFKNIVPVLMFAVVGTGISIVTTGLLFKLVCAAGII